MVFHARLQEDPFGPHVRVSARRSIPRLPAFVLALPFGPSAGISPPAKDSAHPGPKALPPRKSFQH
jgi:hypothetical protein